MYEKMKKREINKRKKPCVLLFKVFARIKRGNCGANETEVIKAKKIRVWSRVNVKYNWPFIIVLNFYIVIT